jgi:ABC-2 type transport system permease protein
MTTAPSATVDRPGSSNANPWLAAATLTRREITRFHRQRSRIIGALGTPFVFWLVIGSGLGESFQPAGVEASTGYLTYAFPGTIVLILLFTAIFSTISIIEDRANGFLQGVLVAPISRWSIVLGKIGGGSAVAVAQGLVFLILGPTIGINLSAVQIINAVAVMILLAVALSALGFCIAWTMSSTQGFHAIMNLFLIPMWLLSGAFFPASGAAWLIAFLIKINPLSYGVALLRHVIGQPDNTMPGLALCIWVSLVFGAVMFLAAVRICAEPKRMRET